MRRILRDRFNTVLGQWRKYQERSAWLYDNQGHPEFEKWNERVSKTGARMGTLRDELCQFAECCPMRLTELVVVCGEGQDEWEALVPARPAAGGGERA